MDSDDEATGQKKTTSPASPSDANAAPSSPVLPPVELPSSIREVKTFSEFLRLGPVLKTAAPNLSVDELVGLCETAARLKFFDGDLFDEVFVHLKRSIQSRKLSIQQITSVASSLVDLNAYNASIFAAAAKELTPLIKGMSKEQRLQWIKLLSSAGHRDDESFEMALRTAPLPGGDDAAAADGFMLCWEFMRGGCPRGNSCRWTHPGAKKNEKTGIEILMKEANTERILRKE